MVQWLRIPLPMQGMQVRSLVGKLGSHVPQDTVTREACACEEDPVQGPPNTHIVVTTMYTTNSIPGNILSIYMFYLVHSSNIPMS